MQQALMRVYGILDCWQASFPLTAHEEPLRPDFEHVPDYRSPCHSFPLSPASESLLARSSFPLTPHEEPLRPDFEHVPDYRSPCHSFPLSPASESLLARSSFPLTPHEEPLR